MNTKRIISRIAFGMSLFAITYSATAQQASISNLRKYDKSGLNVFETPKKDTAKYNGLKVRIGGNFTQSFQVLKHSNDADPNIVNGANGNQLLKLTPGFNTAIANLNLDVQLDDGVRMNLISYLSARHHQETWVKGGYIQFDKLPFLKSEVLDKWMEFLTIKIGHMEINYGDAHFRRSDNGNSLYNPFIENYILDAFTTEIGGEISFQNKGFIAMYGITGGELKGDVLASPVNPTDDKAEKSPSIYGKFGFDKQLSDRLRLRLTGSIYSTASSTSNTLYGGDRSGSHYYFVMENAATANQFTSGRLNPGFSDKVTSMMGNLFVKYSGLEFFGTYERSKGRSNSETSQRDADQLAVELIYRFGKTENFFVGGRYNTVSAELKGYTSRVSVDRMQAGAGWFITKNLLFKGEFVKQNYNDFPRSDIRSNGQFNGIIVEAIVGF